MRELLRRLVSKPGLALEIGIASLFANVLALATPLFVIQVLNRYVAQGVDATLVTLTTGTLLAVLLEFIFRQVRVRLARSVSEQADTDISMAAYGILIKAKAGALDRIPVGQRGQVISAAQKIETAYSGGNIAAIFDVPFSILFVGVLYLLSPVLASITVLFLFFVYFAGTIGAYFQQKISRKLLQESASGNVLVNSASEQIDTVRAFNASAYLYQSWRGLLVRSMGKRRNAEAIQNRVATLSQSASALMSIAIISIGAMLVVAGKLDVGTMIGANILAARALMPITRFSQLGAVFANAAESLLLLKEFSTIPHEASSGSTKPDYSGSIEFRDMAFTHPGHSTPMFETFNLVLKPKTIMVVSGANGTGKTTLARLVAGVLEPVRGQILIDGLDLQQASLSWWRSQIAYLPQEPTLLNTTIRENLQIVNTAADEARISQAVLAAGLSKFLDESADGLDLKVTNNGANLSLGIRRRIALARALLSNCKLAIFDEPTEGLDREGIAAVYAVMADLAARGCSIIVISHDSKIIKGAHILVDLNFKPVPKITERPHYIAAKQLKEQEAS